MSKYDIRAEFEGQNRILNVKMILGLSSNIKIGY